MLDVNPTDVIPPRPSSPWTSIEGRHDFRAANLEKSGAPTHIRRFPSLLYEGERFDMGVASSVCAGEASMKSAGGRHATRNQDGFLVGFLLDGFQWCRAY